MFSKKKKDEEEIFDTVDTDSIDTDITLDTQFEEDASKPPKKKLPGWVIIPVIAVFGIIIFAASKISSGGTDSKLATLQVTKVSSENVKEVYNASGKIESENTKTYYAPVTAPIVQCNAIVGNTVKAGELLISFDTTNLERDNQQAQLTLQSSLNTTQATKAKNAKAIDAANNASSQAANQANELADEVNSLAAQVDAAWAAAQVEAPELADLNNALTEQQTKLSANQAIIDETDANYGGRRADLDAANAKESKDDNDEAIIKALQPVFDKYDAAVTAANEAQAEITKLNTQITAKSASSSTYNALQAEYDAAYAKWQAAYDAANASPADTSMSEAEIASLNISDNLAELAALTPAELVAKGKEGMKADMNGVIASSDAQKAGTATQGIAMFTIASTDQVRVKIDVSPDDYEKMKLGNEATITVGQSKYTGQVTKVNKIAINNEKGNPVIGTEIRINNPDENICIGATAKISMTIAEADNVLAVPTEVINSSSDGNFVYVIENGVVKKKTVELGTASTTLIEIKSGLKDGDQVVNDLNVDIKEGMKATPINTDTAKK